MWARTSTTVGGEAEALVMTTSLSPGSTVPT